MAIEQIKTMTAIANGDRDGPLVMLNLNRYRERAAYEGEVPGGATAEVPGEEAYLRYGVVAQAVLERLGGRILWHARSGGTVIGEEKDRYDEVIAVWYPSAAAFVSTTRAGRPGRTRW